ncbi:DNA polymerase/3'-5' exonuclease PolX [Halopelagius longus]|uniref:DNA polymerase beta n=1 Tax=Halopelagius longus TaxID=1236180 RepID=A0A1H1D9U3_9EURY|nr:DNA polymerase/3'-5' exonuclease PolX [Halopelagius longus]RDI71238.1 DNA polymerase/3'-5' exonuclease PolX [Halopelagius longus]SDQ73222.1 DNA polymerase (family 10) [Halopelagius longus]
MSRNADVAALFEEFADRLAAKGVEYKPNAYRRAADNIRAHDRPIEGLAAEGEEAVAEIEGVGDAISSKVVEYFETGEIEELAELRDEMPVDIQALTSVEGVGPKTAGTLYEALGITTLDELEAAAEAGEIREVSGFGAKTEENILSNVAFARQAQERERIGDARPLADDVLELLRGDDAVSQAEVAGSIRRWRDTIGDVDVLVASEDAASVVETFTGWAGASTVIESGPEKASVRADGVRIDLRVVVPEEYGAALQYFTGSKNHNLKVRNVAIRRDLKMNEYGVFDVSDVEDPDADQRVGERIAGETEESMYAALDMPLIPPELREDTGEVEAALDGDLPDLIERSDLRGDLHTHTNWSDGRNSPEEMVAAAEERGYDYYAVTDHATGPGMVGGVGLDDDELREQMDALREAAADADLELLCGVEANIDAEGGIPTDDEVLAELDVVVASPHAALDQDPEAATERLIRAVEHPSVDIVGHPTGRLINDRAGLDIDVRRVAEAAAEHDVALEINADPARLDLHGERVKTAVEAGATVAVDTDAHRPETLDYARYGVHTARRGWCEPADVLNARDLSDLRSFLH